MMMMKIFIRKSLFFFLTFVGSIYSNEGTLYQAITLTPDQFLEFINRQPEPDYISIHQKIIPGKNEFGYLPAKLEIELDNAWGMWLVFAIDSTNHFEIFDDVWLIPMTEEEKELYPNLQVYFNSYQGDIVERYFFTHWIIPRSGHLAFPAINTPTQLHIKCLGWDY